MFGDDSDDSGLLGGAREAAVRRAAGQITPSETEQGQAVAKVLGGIESSVAESASKVSDVFDADIDVDTDAEQRQEEILSVLDAAVEGRETVAREVCERRGIDPEAAKHCVSCSQWEQTKKEWKKMYRERGAVEEDVPVDIVADQHCRSVYGVSRTTIEELLVGSDRQQLVVSGLIHPTTELCDTIDAVVEERDES